MPKKGEIDTAYPDRLQAIGITLLEPFRGAKKHHRMECTVCAYAWTATPISKVTQGTGCPQCAQQERDKRDQKKKEAFLKQLHERFNIVDLNGYDGTQKYTGIKIRVQNPECGHTFEADPRNLITRNVNCPICNKEEKTRRLNDSSEERSREWRETADEWEAYKSVVRCLTEKVYAENKHIINPNDLPRGIAGQEGAYQLDHIVPVRWCFDNNMLPEWCARLENLQMLDWLTNVSSKDKLKE